MTHSPGGQFVRPDKGMNKADILGAAYGVSGRTIRRDAQFALALDRLADLAGDEVRDAVLSRDVKLTRQDVMRLDRLAARDPEAAKQAIAAALSGQTRTVRANLRAQGEDMRVSRRMAAARELWATLLDAMPQLNQVASTTTDLKAAAVISDVLTGLARALLRFVDAGEKPIGSERQSDRGGSHLFSVG